MTKKKSIDCWNYRRQYRRYYRCLYWKQPWACAWLQSVFHSFYDWNLCNCVCNSDKQGYQVIIYDNEKNLLPVLIAVTVFTITGCRDKAYQYVEKAPDSFAQVISEGLTENLKFKNCHTVKSKKYPGSWYAAGELYGGKMSGSVVGVWILDNYDNPGNVLSVDQTAIAFSVYKAAKHDKPEARITNVKEARILKKYIEKSITRTKATVPGINTGKYISKRVSARKISLLQGKEH